jgi:diguanylate cyclase (GGDEF)-like protein
VHGVLLVAGRMGAGTTFNSSDLALLETFGRHVATSLERGRLEETLRQVTDLKEQLRHQTLHDALTGLPNRTLFLDRARQAVDVAARTHAWPAVLYLDLDGFKPVNDEYGHDIGDAVLRTIATRLRGCLRPADTAARLGGDEFAILLGGPIDPQSVNRVVDRVRAQFDVPVDLGDGRVAKIGASIGIAVGDPGTEDADGLIRQSDIAMYAAKRSGGGTVYYEAGMGDPTSAREQQVADLTRAIAHGELFTVFQPLINLRTGRPTGAEALVRWQHPEDGLRSPDEFIGLAEETGTIVPLGRKVLEAACAEARHWQRLADGDFFVSVNLAVRQAHEPDLVEQVTGVLERAGLDPSLLVLELTESAIIGPAAEPLKALRALHDMGIRLAIDDFGTGYSNLAYLRRLPVYCIKIAASFVSGMAPEPLAVPEPAGGQPPAPVPVDEPIVGALVGLAHALDLRVIAEGVETANHAERLEALGCDLGQGWFFGRPQSPDQISGLLKETRQQG